MTALWLEQLNLPPKIITVNLWLPCLVDLLVPLAARFLTRPMTRLSLLVYTVMALSLVHPTMLVVTGYNSKTTALMFAYQLSPQMIRVPIGGIMTHSWSLNMGCQETPQLSSCFWFIFFALSSKLLDFILVFWLISFALSSKLLDFILVSFRISWRFALILIFKDTPFLMRLSCMSNHDSWEWSDHQHCWVEQHCQRGFSLHRILAVVATSRDSGASSSSHHSILDCQQVIHQWW